jgi:hypothetical protein
MNLVLLTLTPETTQILIRTYQVERYREEPLCLRFNIREMVDFFQILDEEAKSVSRVKEAERLTSIKNFSRCFLDSMYLENRSIRFNQKRKLQKLIQLLNEDSAVNFDEKEDNVPLAK